MDWYGLELGWMDLSKRCKLFLVDDETARIVTNPSLARVSSFDSLYLF
jgi:hypothetical protein